LKERADVGKLVTVKHLFV